MANERSYNTESEYEYGSRAGWWRLFRLFQKYGMNFTLYGVAQAVEENPDVAKRCVEEGHDVASQWVSPYPFSYNLTYILSCSFKHTLRYESKY